MSSLRNAGATAWPTLVSRILGLVRDSIMMAVMGVNWASGVFQLAWMIPNMTRRLFGEGALSASFVPRYAAALDRDGPEAARALLARVSGTLATGLVLLAGIAVTLCLILPPGTLGLDVDQQVAAADSLEGDRLFFELSAILLPYLVPICLVALLAGALQSHGSFALPAAGPIVLNVFWIGGLILAAPLGFESPQQIAVCVAWFLTVGGLAQLAMLGWALHRRRALPRPRFGWPPAGDPARVVFVGMVPAIVGLSLSQINVLIDQAMAVYLIAPGANNYIYLSNRLLLFPHALTTISMAVAVFPRLAVLAAQRDGDGFHRELDGIVTASLFLSIPASVGMIMVLPDLVPLLFEHGRFRESDSAETFYTATCMLVGLPAMGVAQLFARGLYALDDLRSPAKVSALLVLANFGINLWFVLGLGLRTAGLSLASSVTAVLNAVMLGWLLHRRAPGRSAFAAGLVRALIAAGVMAATIYGVTMLLGDAPRVVRVAIGIAVGIAVYLGCQAAIGSPELRRLAQKLRERRAR